VGRGDELLMEGQRPTIEKIRQRLGRGSPNTVSPMLDRWFSSLGRRLSDAVGPSAEPSHGNMPLTVTQLMTKLWDGALTEAARVEGATAQAQQRELELQGDALQKRDAALIAQEQSFESHRARLDAALSGAQQAVTTMTEQLAAAQARCVSAEEQLARVRDKVDGLASNEIRMREIHRVALETKTRAAEDAENRHVANERRLLAEVDRERQAARTTLAELAKEQKLRCKAEETTASLNTAVSAAQREIDQAAGALAHKSQEVERVRDDLDAKLMDARTALTHERAAHQQTRDMLSRAIANTPIRTKNVGKRAARGSVGAAD
jgi:chromosome segregation ATPase